MVLYIYVNIYIQSMAIYLLTWKWKWKWYLSFLPPGSSPDIRPGDFDNR